MRKKSFEDFYLVEFEDQAVVLAASSDKEAIQRGVEHFRLKSRQRSNLKARLMTYKEVKRYGLTD